MLNQELHMDMLEKAIHAVHERSFFAAYPEHPKAYSEEGNEKGLQWFNEQLGNNFTELLQAGENDYCGDEASPYTQKMLDIKYPSFTPGQLVDNAKAGQREWRYTNINLRAAILIDSLERIKHRFFDIAYATMHTTGQPYMMSFQASGPHANDRALETIAIAVQEIRKFPHTAQWEKPMGKFNITVNKTWRALGRGVALVIGCSTFPVWNSIPGLYASLITGNAVIVKPHPGAILPIAIVVAEIQKALSEVGFNPNLVQLAADTNSNPITKELAEHPDVKIIDYTGGNHFGDYIERLPGKIAFTEKAGVNSVILDSTNNLDAVLQNMAFAASLYSGQMCTAPQNFFIPASGVKTQDGTISYDEVVEKLAAAIDKIATDPKMGPGTLGAIQSLDTRQRVVDANNLEGRVLTSSKEVENPDFPHARTASPILLEVSADNKKIFSHEHFGPIAMVIKTTDTKQSVALAKELAQTKGAISCGAYTTDHTMRDYIMAEMEDAFTPVAFNLTGPIWMNQNAAFSDFHVTGGNPAGNATFTDAAYVVRRFVWVGHKEGVI